MAKNKIQHYFLYALGEILLVVIGILIALQVNNWNEERKNDIKEGKILVEILNDLETARDDLENDIEVQIRSLKEAERLKNHLLEQKPYTDSIRLWLVAATYNTQFTPRTSGYKSLQSIGLDIIENDLIRKEILYLFDITFNLLINKGNQFDSYSNPKIDIEPFLKANFVIDQSFPIVMGSKEIGFTFETDYIKVKDYQALLDNNPFLSVLQKTIYDRGEKIEIYIRGMNRVERLVDVIEKELEND